MENRVKMLFLAIGLCNVFDYFFTLHVLQHGFIEGNPVMAPVIGTGWFFAIKVVLIPAALAAIWMVRSRIGGIARLSLWICAGAYGGLMAYFVALMGAGMVPLS